MGLSYNPLQSPSYIAGTITISGAQIGVPVSLHGLVKDQLDANAAASFLGITLQSDDGNGQNVYVGVATKIGGALSATNFGYRLLPGTSNSYRQTAGAGYSIPFAGVQVFCTAAATLHIELY